MKRKDIVTLVFLLVGIVVVFAVVQKSGILGAFGSLLGPTSGGDIAGGGIAGGGIAGGGIRFPGPPGRLSLPADVMTGPNTGASQIGGGPQFGPASSPIANNPAVNTTPPAQIGTVQSGQLSVPVVRGTIGPDAAKVIDANTVSVNLPNVPSAARIGIGGGIFAGNPQGFLGSLVAPTVAPVTPGGAPGGGFYFAGEDRTPTSSGSTRGFGGAEQYVSPIADRL